MKFYLVTLVLSIYVVNIQSRPQNVQLPYKNDIGSPFLLQPRSKTGGPQKFVPISYRAFGNFDNKEVELLETTTLSNVSEEFGREFTTLPTLLKSTEKLVDGRKLKRKRRPARRNKPKRVTNLQLLNASQSKNKDFDVERFLFESQPSGKLQVTQQSAKLQAPTPNSGKLKVKKQKLQKRVKVDVTGSTTADSKNRKIPDIPDVPPVSQFFGFQLPTTNNRNDASLIIEPSSKAVAGNDGTAVSAPLSHAMLKYGSNAKIWFRPESVAIVGANGIAHAQADLLIDYVKK